MLHRIIAGAALAASLAGVAAAQDASAGGPGSATAYVTAAGQSDEFEIAEGKLAVSHGQSAGVRQFGAKMIKDHTKSTQMVKMAAKKSGLAPSGPPPLLPDQQQMLSQLRAAPSSGFDKLYVQQQLQAHQQALQAQEAYAQGGGDANLKMVAAKIVPVVKAHISMLQSM